MIMGSKSRRLFWYTLLIVLILSSNFLLYRLPSIQPVPNGAVAGSIMDLMLVIPLLTYFFVIRKRYSLKYLGFVVLAGYAAALFIIPGRHMQSYPFVRYAFVFSEGVLFLVEAFILFKILTKFPKLRREYKRLSDKDSLFQYNLKTSLELHLPDNRALYIFLSELSIFYYSLFSWHKQVKITHGMPFTYHKKASTIAVYVMLIHATVIESIGLHYFLHQWNEIAAYILLFLNIYGILYFLGEIQATRLTPYVLEDQRLYVQTGLAKSMDIPLENIKEFKYYDGPEKFTKIESRTLWDARAADFIVEKPTFELVLKKEQDVTLMYGLKRKVNRVVLNVDEPQSFLSEIQSRLKEDDPKI
ncbi:hypothetical protein V1498_13275 [Peribacillus sp. SCS-26]|uniref:hypothetical protein n=1 Tax=Paraperibacillus marinus TaxID=3115295 RepID=UPI0039065324